MKDIAMKRRPAAVAFCAMGAAIFVQTQSARADAIDGDWCSVDGRQVSIHGPTITTPEGTRIQGAYSRHSFIYTTPASESQAGQEVSMQLLSETMVNVRTGATAPSQVWRRCPGTTS